MKLGEIKIEALKIMFANYSLDLQIDDIQGLVSDENYGSYLVNMNGSIARALDRIENACVLPLRVLELSIKDFVSKNGQLYFDVNSVDDLFLIERIVLVSNELNIYDTEAPYVLEGCYLVVEDVCVDAKYKIIYYSKAPEIEGLSDEDNLEIPNKLARLIPYFVKGDLYQEEEPNLASEARNLFEASLDDLKHQNFKKQSYVAQNLRMW